MELDRDREGLIWTLPVARAAAAEWVRFGGLTLVAVALGVAGAVALQWEPYVDPAAGCPDGPECPVERWSDADREDAKQRFLAAASCDGPSALQPDPLRRAKRLTLQDVRTMSRWSAGPCRAWIVDPLSPDQLRTLLSAWDTHVPELERDAYLEAVRVVRDRALSAHARAREATTWTLAIALMVALAGGLVWLAGRLLGAPVVLRVRRDGLHLDGTAFPFRYLRATAIEGGRLELRDVERTRVRTPALADADQVGRVLPLIRDRCGADGMTEAELDALERSIDPERGGVGARLGSLRLRWTHEGARTVLIPAATGRWWAIGALGAALISGGVLTVGSAPFLVPGPVWGSVSAAGCAAGDPRCAALGVDDPSASIDAYARVRVCALVDGPIAEASYDDAISRAAEARGRRVPANALLDQAAAGRPCRAPDWQLGDPTPSLRALWLAGPRNTNVVDEGIAAIVAGAETQIRAEWASAGGGHVQPWANAIASARGWWLQLAFAAVMIGFGGMGLVAWARRNSRRVPLSVEARRLVVEGRALPYDAIRAIAVRQGALHIELEEGASWVSPALDDPDSTAALVDWIRGRIGAGTAPVPQDLNRLRRAVEG